MIGRIIKLIISIFYFAVRHILLYFYNMLFNKHVGTFAVLLYHEIKDSQKYKFERQMKTLLKIAVPVSAEFEKKSFIAKHYAAVTFDDGFRSVIDNAIPVLTMYNIPAALFIPTAYFGEHPGWINPEKNKYKEEIVLTEDQLLNLNTDLISIGSHTVTHRRLTFLEEEEIKEELSQSKYKLEKILKREIKTLAFPYGNYNKKVIELAIEAGYNKIFTILPDSPFLKNEEVLTGRISVSVNDWPVEFFLKLTGGYDWLPVAVKMKGKVLRCL